MGKRKIGHIISGFISMLAFVTLISKVQAQQPIDMMSCGDVTLTTIVTGEELTIRVVERNGINIDNLANKAFNNMTYHSVGLSKIASRKMMGTFYSKYMDPSGDFFPSLKSRKLEWKLIGSIYMAPANGKRLMGEAKPLGLVPGISSNARL